MKELDLTEVGPWEDVPTSLYESSDCPSCGAEVPAPIGTLGALKHYRCQCWQWAEKATATTGEAKCLK